MTLRAGSYTVFEPENIERDSPIIGIGHGLAPIDGYRNVEVVDVAEVERLRTAAKRVLEADMLGVRDLDALNELEAAAGFTQQGQGRS